MRLSEMSCNNGGTLSGYWPLVLLLVLVVQMTALLTNQTANMPNMYTIRGVCVCVDVYVCTAYLIL